VRWTIPDLNTRETAALIWVGLVLVFALAIPSGREILVDATKLVSKPFVAILLAATTLVAVAIMAGLAWLGYWQVSMMPTTVVWFLGTAVVATFSTEGVSELRRLAIRTVALTALVEFVSNAYSFPLPIELLLVPTIVAAVTLSWFAGRRAEFSILRKPFAVVCVALLIGTITPSVVYLVEHVGELASTERAREFLLPLVLTASIIPYFYLVRMAIAWQTALTMLKGQMEEDPALFRAARRAVLSSCHVSLSRIQLFEPVFRWRLGSATSVRDIEDAMRDFKLAARERPWRSRNSEKRSALTDLLPGAASGNLLIRSVALAETVQTALSGAAEQSGHTEAEMRELFDRLGELDGLSAVSPVARAEVIRVLAPDRSIEEIELIAPELGKLSSMHATDIAVLASDFDELLRLAGFPATASLRLAGELHAISAASSLPLDDAVQAFVTLLGGTVTDIDQSSQDE
jgi:hypothetical protein